jgi:hypothetical protein
MSKATGERLNPNTCSVRHLTRAVDTVKYWTDVFDILDHELINCPDDLGNEVTETHATKLRDISQSDLHKITARSRLMSYNDMIGWALDNVDISTRSICNSQKVDVGSFLTGAYTSNV